MNKHIPSVSDVTVVMTAMTDPERPWVIEALDSVMSQTLRPDRVLVLVETNNSWLDHELKRSAYTGEVARLVRVHRIPLARLGAVRNSGTRLANTGWIAFIDGDDIWEPQKLARQLDVARARPDVDFIGTDYVFVNERSQRFGYSNGSNPTPSSWLVRRELLLKYPFEPDATTGEDYLWLKATRGVCVRERVPETLVRYRIRRNSISALLYGHSTQRKLREFAARLTQLGFLRFLMLAATYVRYVLNRRARYDV